MLAPPPATRVHTVFCAECTEDYDYKSLGVYHSHNLSGMPGARQHLPELQPNPKPNPNPNPNPDRRTTTPTANT